MVVIGVDPGVRLHGYAVVEFLPPGPVVRDCGHQDLRFIQRTFVDRETTYIGVEYPVYQGAMRTQASILSTAFAAGYFSADFKAIPLTPSDWKLLLWGKKAGVTTEMVTAYVSENVAADYRAPSKKALPHVNDAICIAIATRKLYTASFEGTDDEKVKQLLSDLRTRHPPYQVKIWS